MGLDADALTTTPPIGAPLAGLFTPCLPRASLSAVVAGSAVFCGGEGQDDNGDPAGVADCYALDLESNSWVGFPSLPQPVAWAASVVMDEGWWIVGEAQF